MAEQRFEFYICNKYFFDPEKEEILLCNNSSYCDPDTKERRRCKKVVLILENVEQKKIKTRLNTGVGRRFTAG